MFSNHNGVKLQIINRKKYGKFMNMWKLQSPEMGQRRMQKRNKKIS